MKKVYLIRAAQFYKIGISNNVTKRLGAVQTGCPIKCEYVGYFPSLDPEQLERHLHLTFQDCKTWGEWFDLGDDNVRRLITEFNLKHVVNPFAEVTQETERTQSSSALKDARGITAQVNEACRVFEQCLQGKKVTNEGKKEFRRMVSKYSFDALTKSMLHLSEKFDSEKFWDKLENACKTYSKYGRFVSDRTWRAYHIMIDQFGKPLANDMLTHVMENNIDNKKWSALLIGDDHILHIDDSKVYITPKSKYQCPTEIQHS